jgi:hypothetical protein
MTNASEDSPKKRRQTGAQTPSRQPSASEAERLERQAEALRANLRRRKDQSRGRATPEEDG